MSNLGHNKQRASVEDVEWDLNKYGHLEFTYDNRNKMKDLLDRTGCGFCLAKWTQVTMHLGNGLTHSCHHPGAHKIPLEEVKKNPAALHNTNYKKERRKEMLNNQRPAECDFCWRVEDNGEISDRVLKSMDQWSKPHHDMINSLTGDEDWYPSYVEVSFARTCNFKCSYCGPAFSSKWHEEIKQTGHYDILNHKYNQIRDDEKHYAHNEDNPYIEAWWKWFPEAYKHMHTLRITGGEPLLCKDTFKVMDWLIENPNPELEFSINTNACPPDKLWEKFIEKAKILTENNCVKKFAIYVSAEATGPRTEYIRDGMDWDMFRRNVESFLDQTVNTRANFMCAFNFLSVTSFGDFLKWVLKLKQKYSYQGFFEWLEAEGITRHDFDEPSFKERKGMIGVSPNRIGIDIPYVRHPRFMDAQIVTMELIEKYLIPAVDFMYSNLGTPDWYSCSRFEDWEAMKLKRIVVDCILKAKQDDDYTGLSNNYEVSKRRAEFARFVEEYDNRRGKDFTAVFPELTDFYELCMREYRKLYNAPEDEIDWSSVPPEDENVETAQQSGT